MLTRKKIIIRSKFVYKFSLTARRGKFFSIQVNLISRHDVLAYTKKHELDVLKCISNNDFLIDCSSCHVTYAFQSESTLYSCLNVNELLSRSRHEIWTLSDCSWTRINFWVKVLFLQKMLIFYKKNTEISKIKRILVLKGIFSETTYRCVLTYQISSF